MLKIKHKGLRNFAASGSLRGIQPAMAGKLARMLHDLAAAQSLDDLANTAYRLHPLQGDLAGHWSIRVSGNWRITFRWTETGPDDVDLVDYH